MVVPQTNCCINCKLVKIHLISVIKHCINDCLLRNDVLVCRPPLRRFLIRNLRSLWKALENSRREGCRLCRNLNYYSRHTRFQRSHYKRVNKTTCVLFIAELHCTTNIISHTRFLISIYYLRLKFLFVKLENDLLVDLGLLMIYTSCIHIVR